MDVRSVDVDAVSSLRASRSDPERFAEVFDLYFAEIHAYVARRLTPDIADDVASETFLAAFRQRDRFDASLGEPRAWLYGIATNLIRRHRRSEIRAYRAMHRMPYDSDAIAGHEDRVVAQLAAKGALAGALASLPAGDRDVLLLVALAELTYEEVAAALGIAYGTVCSRLNRARRKVRERLKEYEGRARHG